MDELKVMKRLGISTSPFVAKELEKCVRSVMRQLESWEKVGEVRRVESHHCSLDYGVKRWWLTNEIYKDYFEEKED